MKKLTWILIIFTCIGGALDIYTTEALLNTGAYYEQNPIFYVLGNTGFVTFFTTLTTVACIIISYVDLLCQKEHCSRKFLTRSLAVLSFYAILHWYLGVNQLIFLVNFRGGI